MTMGTVTPDFYRFNEAEARTPRMLPPCNPLVIKAILPSFRERVSRGRRNRPDLGCGLLGLAALWTRSRNQAIVIALRRGAEEHKLRVAI